MGVAKALVGAWMLVWPDRGTGRGWLGRRTPLPTTDVDGDADIGNTPTSLRIAPPPVDFTPLRSAALVGLAMIARGEIALIVAEIARPLLGGDAAEPFAVVMWATLLNTAGGAIFVGFLLRERKAPAG
ncbi:hypothetical protein FB451DRAFT_1394441 [Mycena latifolia]|nr:hypothetical protein FB451DRAFT_1394441 [Mycena latifolia]